MNARLSVGVLTAGLAASAAIALGAGPALAGQVAGGHHHRAVPVAGPSPDPHALSDEIGEGIEPNIESMTVGELSDMLPALKLALAIEPDISDFNAIPIGVLIDQLPEDEQAKVRPLFGRLDTDLDKEAPLHGRLALGAAARAHAYPHPPLGSDDQYEFLTEPGHKAQIPSIVAAILNAVSTDVVVEGTEEGLTDLVTDATQLASEVLTDLPEATGDVVTKAGDLIKTAAGGP